MPCWCTPTTTCVWCDAPRELTDLRQYGMSMAGQLSPNELAELNAFLLSRPVYFDAHVPQTARNRGDLYPIPRDAAEASECVCVRTDDAVTAPHLLELALKMTDVASAYLGRDPAVSYSANVFWTRPGPAGERPDIQAFHCDQDDERFLAMFVYLTDVLSDADGPQDLFGPDGTCRTITGPAGTVFLADTSREHRGRKPLVRERGLAWWRWGVSDHPPAGVWDKIEPVASAALGNRYPANAKLRESIRLLVNP